MVKSAAQVAELAQRVVKGTAFQDKAIMAVSGTTQVAVAVVVLAATVLTHLAQTQVAQVERQAQTVTQGQASPIQVAVVVVVLRRQVQVEQTQGTAEQGQVLTALLIVAVAVAVLAVRTLAVTAVQVVSWCAGSPQTQPHSQSASQAQPRTAQTVHILGMRGIAQELWWWHNGSFRKGRERCRA